MKLTPAWWRRRRLVREIGLAAIEMIRARRVYLKNLSAYKVGDDPFPTYPSDQNLRAAKHLSALVEPILREETHD